MMNNIKFHKQEIYKNGITKTEYYINDKKVDERTYNTLLDNDFESRKNTYIKSKYDDDYENLEDKIHFINLNPQYIQALEEDYEESECENISDYNSMCDRCKAIMDVVRVIRDSEDEEEAFENLEYFTNLIDEQAFKNGHISALRNYSDMFTDLADKIENDEFEEK